MTDPLTADDLARLHREMTPDLTVEIEGDPGDTRVISIPEIGRAFHDSDWADEQDFDRDEINARGFVLLRNALPQWIADKRRIEKLREKFQRSLAFHRECEARELSYGGSASQSYLNEQQEEILRCLEVLAILDAERTPPAPEGT
jgi:hypothetical protein